MWVAAAGDDVVIFVDNALGQTVKRSILENSSRVTEGQVGLGQCIKDVSLRKWWDIDFCSKWAFTTTGLVSDWFFYRDVSKALKTRHYYSK